MKKLLFAVGVGMAGAEARHPESAGTEPRHPEMAAGAARHPDSEVAGLRARELKEQT